MKPRSVFALLVIALLISLFFINWARIKSYFPRWFKKSKESSAQSEQLNQEKIAKLAQAVLPDEGIILPIEWRNLSQQLIETGVIDQVKFEDLYKERDQFDDEMKQLIENSGDSQIKITTENANVLLNLFWAFGLANKNPILENGPMTDPRNGGVQGFASTGGWNLASGNAMDHYSKHEFVILTPKQQTLVEKMAKNIYRPCCNNSTYFPDCNHGMAMLGLLELMAASGNSEESIYKVALQVNSYWFPGYYPLIAEYKQTQGVAWDKVDAKEVLGAKFSSAGGYKSIEAKVSPSGKNRGASCGA